MKIFMTPVSYVYLPTLDYPKQELKVSSSRILTLNDEIN